MDRHRTRTAPARIKNPDGLECHDRCGTVAYFKTLERDDWKEHAQQIFEALDGELHHCRIDGHVTAPALLDDYAWMTLLSARLGKMDRSHAYPDTVETKFLDTDGGYFTTDVQKQPYTPENNQ